MPEEPEIVLRCLRCGHLFDVFGDSFYCRSCFSDYNLPKCQLCGFFGEDKPALYCEQCRDHLERIKQKFLFDPGQIRATPRARKQVLKSSQHLYDLLHRYLVTGDHGELSENERGQNYINVKRGYGRIIARYRLSTGAVVYISTEGNRCVTTIFTSQDW